MAVRYDRSVHGPRVFAAILVLTLSASPVVLDRCLISCEAGAGRQASSATAVLSCHGSAAGASSAAPRLLAPRPACGHDHLSSSAVLVPATHQVDRPSPAVFAAVTSAPPRAVVVGRSFGSPSPPGASPPAAAPSPLRI